MPIKTAIEYICNTCEPPDSGRDAPKISAALLLGQIFES